MDVLWIKTSLNPFPNKLIETTSKISAIPGKIANAGFATAAPALVAYALGTPYTGALGVNAFTYDNFKFVWPLPQLELDANPTLRPQQNPGY